MKTPGGHLRLRVLRADLTRKVFEVTCLFCGKVFYSKHPYMARFCGVNHRVQWNVREEKRKHPHGRPTVKSKLFAKHKLDETKKT